MKIHSFLGRAALCFGLFTSFFSTKAADIIWTNTFGGNWATAANWQPNIVPGSLDRAFITNSGGYTVTVTTGTTVSDLTVGGDGLIALVISGGTLSITNTGTFTTNGEFYLSSGTFSGGGATTLNGVANYWDSGMMNGGGTLTIASGAVFTIQTGNDHDMPTRTLNNSGTISWTGGRIRQGLGSSISNSGRWFTTANNAINGDYGGAMAFNNTGTVEVPSGTFSISVPGSGNGVFTNASGAAINFNTDYTFNNGTQFRGAGINRINGGTATMNGTITTENLELFVGTLAGTQTFVGTVNWIATYLGASGTTTIPSGSTLNITTGNDHNLPSRTLINSGVVNWTGGRIRQGLNSLINNSNLWVITANNAMNNDYGGASAFNNNATVEVPSGTFSVSVTGTTANLFTNAAGATINFNTDYVFNSGTALRGGGTFRINGGTATFNGDITVDYLELFVGTLAGTHTFYGPVNWIATYLGTSGTTTIPTNFTFTISSGNDHNMPTRTLNNGGTILWTGGRIRGGLGTTAINNTNLFLVQTDNVINHDYGGGSVTVNNMGTFRKNTTTGTTAIASLVAFNNTGTVDLQSGALNLDGGGSSPGSWVTASGTTINFDTDHTLDIPVTFSGAGAVRFVGGSITLNGTFDALGFELVGATLNGTNTFTGQLTWTSGALGGNTNRTTVATGGVMNIVSGNDHQMPGHVLINDGTVNWTGGRIRNGQNSIINNNGLWAATSGSTFNNDYGGASSFNNYGTFKSTAGAVDISITGTANGIFTNTTGTAINFNTDYSFTDGIQFRGTGVNRINGGTATMSGNVYSDNLELFVGALAGTQSFIGSINWIATYLGNTGTTTITTNSTLTISTGNDHNMPNRSMNNNGTITWTGGRIRGASTVGGTIILNNANLFRVQTDNVINDDYGGLFVFNNYGTFQKTAGAGTTTIMGGVQFNNTGIVDVQSGTLTLQGGGTCTGNFNTATGTTINFDSGFALNLGVTITGTGAARFTSGGTSLNGAFDFQDFELVGATLSGTHSFSGVITWTSGFLGAGSLTTIDSTGVLNIVSANDHNMPGHALTNNGTINWTGGRIRHGTGSTIVNNALWVTTSGNIINNDYGGSSSFNNNATLRVASGTMTLAISGTSGGVFTNSGTGALVFVSDHVFNSGTSFRGSSVNQLNGANFTLNGTINTENLQLYTGTIYGTNTLVGTTEWVASYLGTTGTTTIPAGSTLNITTGNDHNMPGRTLNNNGVVNWSGGRIRQGLGSSINNNAIWNATAANVLNNDYGGSGVFNNNSVFDVPNGTVNFSVFTVNNANINSASNTVINFNSGLNLNDGSSFTGLGTQQLQGGTHTINGRVVAQNLNFYGSDWAGTGTIAGTNGFDGSLNWVAGNMGTAGVLTIEANATFIISSGNDHNLPTRFIVNKGTGIWTGGRIRGGTADTTITNLGTWLIQTDNVFNHDFGGGVVTFNNKGTLRKTAGTGTTTFTGVILTNSGIVELNKGTLFTDTVYNQGAGQTMLLGGNFQSSQTMLISGGILGGTNTVVANVNNAAQVNPGASLGRLTISGNYTQTASGILNIELSGLVAGTSYDQLQITGSASLNGTLNLTFFPGFCPDANNAFQIMTYGSRSGFFAVTNGVDQGEKGTLVLSYNNANATVTASGLLAPTMVTPPVSRTNNAGETAVFTVATTGECLSYQWKKNGVDLTNSTHVTGAFSPVLTIFNVSQADAANYSVVVSNTGGSVGGGPVSLTVIDPPFITGITAAITNYEGDPVTFTVTATGTGPFVYQWKHAATNLPGATAASLILPLPRPADSGTYAVDVSNAAGTTSTNTSLVVIPDTNAPVIKIIVPSANAHLLTQTVTASGTATDNVRVKKVFYRLLPSTNFVEATLTSAGKNTNWSTALLTLAPGTNYLQAKAVDPAGNETAALTRMFFWDVTSQLTLVTNGNGSVLGLSSGANLLVGRPYKMTALVGPGTNFIFTNWTRVIAGTTNVYSSEPILDFIMESNLTLHANFVTNPFVGASGVYNGLFYEAGGVTHHSAGYCTLKVTKKLTFSGKFSLDGDAVAASGKFTLAGTATKAVSRLKQGKSTLALNIAVDLTGLTNQITGTLADGTNWTSDIIADQWLWATNNPAVKHQGAYTMLLPGFSDDAEGPTGIGHGEILVSDIGKIKISSGALTDGHVLKQNTTLSLNGQWPLFVPLYAQLTQVVTNPTTLVVKTNKEFQGSLLGWVTFATNTAAGSTNLAPLGPLSWIKKHWTNTYYPDGFTNEFSLVSSKYTQPPLGIRALNLTNASITFSNGNLTAPFTGTAFLTTNNAFKVSLPPTNKLTLSFVSKSGQFKGTFIHPVSSVKTAFSGAYLQDYNYGRGFFIGSTKGGTVFLDPQ